MMFPTENIPMPENESEEAVANVETTPVTEGNSEKSGDSEKPEDSSAEQSDSNILIAYFTWTENTLSVMVSGEAHYSVERAAKIMGIPGENIIKVPVEEDFGIRTELLECTYQKTVAEGKIVFCVVGCACTTSVGAFDNLEAVADFAQEHQLWFHVDGAGDILSACDHHESVYGQGIPGEFNCENQGDCRRSGAKGEEPLRISRGPV